MTDIIFILLGLITLVLMFVRHWLLLKRIRQIESDLDSIRSNLERFRRHYGTQTQTLSLQIEELKRRCH